MGVGSCICYAMHLLCIGQQYAGMPFKQGQLAKQCGKAHDRSNPFLEQRCSHELMSKHCVVCPLCCLCRCWRCSAAGAALPRALRVCALLVLCATRGPHEPSSSKQPERHLLQPCQRKGEAVASGLGQQG
jgi:hypothetical protein